MILLLLLAVTSRQKWPLQVRLLRVRDECVRDECVRDECVRMDSPSFAVAEHHFDVHCTSPFTSLALISWRTSSEENVTSYKVHRTLLDSPQENRWVNRFAIAAMGSGAEYHVIDSQAVPGKTYRYRVYGFDESGRLSLATHLTLAERMQPTCLYVPLVYAAESVLGD